MKALLKILKNDLYKVFVTGNADNVQLAKAYFLLAVPVLTVLFTLGNFK
ncbi:hypothetical protein [Mucilaginibacter sp. FT3.2]|nr:hypothetical protein [Mucilaginibacter sp. FT3.2]MBB6233782.1 hypothetical protein [Mucilaginibacter sp. FT3.2]